MMRIDTCLWFDQQAQEAAKFYKSVFKETQLKKILHYTDASARRSGMKAGTVMTAAFTVEGLNIVGLNGGSAFQLNQSMSFFVNCTSEQEISELWAKLADGGSLRMDLGVFPWARKYGWTADKFGVEWQLIYTGETKKLTKIAPAFLFVNDLFGKGEEAVKFYTSIFPNSSITFMTQDERNQTVSHCRFTLDGQEFVLMEGEGDHKFSFNEAFSLVVNCDTQAQIDKYWDALSKGGTPGECGWLKDKYGVSWQVIPSFLNELNDDTKGYAQTMEALLTMKKLHVKVLREAYDHI